MSLQFPDDPAAEVHQLGEPEAVYRRRPGALIGPLLAGLLLLGGGLLVYAAGAAAAVKTWQTGEHKRRVHKGPPHPAVLLAVVAGVGSGFLLGAWWALRRFRRARRVEFVRLYADRMVCVGDGRTEIFRWDEIDGVWHEVSGPLFGKSTKDHPRLEHTYRVRRRDREEVELTGALARVTELGAAVERETARRLMPAALDHFRAGETVDFGTLRVGPEGIEQDTRGGDEFHRTRLWPWNEVHGVAVQEGNIVLHQRHDPLAWPAVAAASDVKNLTLFLELVRRSAGIPVELGSLAPPQKSPQPRETSLLGPGRRPGPEAPRPTLLDGGPTADDAAERAAARWRELPEGLPPEAYQLGPPAAVFQVDAVQIVSRVLKSLAVAFFLAVFICLIPLLIALAATAGRFNWPVVGAAAVVGLYLFISTIWLANLRRELGTLPLLLIQGFVLVWLAVLLLTVGRGTTWMIAGLAVQVAIFGAGLAMVHLWRNDLFHTVVVFGDGLIYLKRNRFLRPPEQRLICRWAEVEVVWMAQADTVDRLVGRDGREVRIDWLVWHYEHARLSGAIAEAANGAMLPLAEAIIRDGGTLPFGAAEVTADRLRLFGADLPWGEVRDLTSTTHGAEVIIRRRGWDAPWAKLDVTKTPNLPLLLALARRMVQQRPARSFDA